MKELLCRKAISEDLKEIITLLADDRLGKHREVCEDTVSSKYKNAFAEISKDSNQYLMVVEYDGHVVATCHMTIMPSLTFYASKRMNIEAVRVSRDCRGQKIGRYMFEYALKYAEVQNVSIVQLSTNKQRSDAFKFYKSLGFEDSHEGMKLYL